MVEKAKCAVLEFERQPPRSKTSERPIPPPSETPTKHKETRKRPIPPESATQEKCPATGKQPNLPQSATQGKCPEAGKQPNPPQSATQEKCPEADKQLFLSTSAPAGNSSKRPATWLQPRLLFSSKSTEKAAPTTMEGKIDFLVQGFKELQQSIEKDRHHLTPLSALEGNNDEEIAEMLSKWQDVKNIINLVDVCSHLRFYAGDAEQNVLSVLRCETCYTYLTRQKTPSLQTFSTVSAAKKGLSG